MNYIARTGTGLYSFYHTKEKGIFRRGFRNGRWQKEQCIAPNTREVFTAAMGEDGIILFCQSAAGDIMMCAERDGFTPRPILENKSNKIYTIQMNPIITSTGICLIYNLPEGDNNYITIQRSVDKKDWSPPERIDRFSSLNDCMFTLRQVSGEHHILFYQNKEMALGYREITPDKLGAFHVFHRGQPLADTAFMTTAEAIHALYIVKGLFANQLVYRKKESAEFSAPVVICEGQKLENCLVYYLGGVLYASFMSGGQLYVCDYRDGGFTAPRRCKDKFCTDLVKAVYISASRMDPQEYLMGQVYVDRNKPYDIQVFPDSWEGFYPAPEVDEDELAELRRQVELLKVQNREQEYRIAYLTRMTED